MAETAIAEGSNANAREDGDDATDQRHQQHQQPPQSQPQSQKQEPEREREQEDTHQSRRSSLSSTHSRPLEATELDEITTATTHSIASLASGEHSVTPRFSAASSSVGSHVRQRRRRNLHLEPLRRFWSRNVALVVAQKGNRDYFALERTFLAYTRTAAAFSMQGVLIAQIFRLPTATRTHFDFRTVGIPLSVAYQCCAIIVAILGAYRFWRQQNAIARGKIAVGGWEINLIGIVTLMAALVLLALAIAIIVYLNIT